MIDFDFYRLMNPELSKLSGEKLLEHYIREGWKSGRDPSALFNVRAYLDRNPDVAKANVEPLGHYLKYGQAEGRAVFLSRWSGRTTDLMTLNDLELCKSWLDINTLRAKNPNLVNLSNDILAAWYLMDGYCEDVGFPALFSKSFYLLTYPDVAASGMSPLLHYLRFGRSEGRFPTLAESKFREAAVPDEVRRDFDANWYRTSYPNIEGDDDALLAHYMTIGWKNGYDPSALFNVRAYLDRNPDVAKANVEPLGHYLKYGRAEGHAAFLSRWSGHTTDLMTLHDLDLCKSWLDINALRAKNPNLVNLSNDTLVAWYLMDGYCEDVGLPALFSKSFYLSTYPDVAASGMSPLRHYLRFGRSEGRFPTHAESKFREAAIIEHLIQTLKATTTLCWPTT